MHVVRSKMFYSNFTGRFVAQNRVPNDQYLRFGKSRRNIISRTDQAPNLSRLRDCFEAHKFSVTFFVIPFFD